MTKMATCHPNRVHVAKGFCRSCYVQNWRKRPGNEDYIYERYRPSHISATVRYRRNRKQQAVDYKGGKCIKCGYNRCLSALEFHHLDPSQKAMSFDSVFICRKWEVVKAELDKTVLVCANCHREIEAGLITV